MRVPECSDARMLPLFEVCECARAACFSCDSLQRCAGVGSTRDEVLYVNVVTITERRMDLDAGVVGP
eukprot:SAG31_NODE_3672_length_4001_cov_3.839313_6_plen_67_part_00